MGLLDFREPVSAWSHFLWMVLAVPGTWLLWHRSRGNSLKQMSLLVFGLSLICCYGGSTLFHAVRLPALQVRAFEILDQMGIFLLIAGSYTPAAVNLLLDKWRWSVLGVTWLLASVGCVFCLVAGYFSPWFTTMLYLAMGWGAILCYFELARVVTHRAMISVVLGGLFYSIGAVLNRLQWPVIWPGVFGAHELFHLFVMAGSLSHFWFMLQVVVPYQRVTTRAPQIITVPANPALEGVLVPEQS